MSHQLEVIINHIATLGGNDETNHTKNPVEQYQTEWWYSYQDSGQYRYRQFAVEKLHKNGKQERKGAVGSDQFIHLHLSGCWNHLSSHQPCCTQIQVRHRPDRCYTTGNRRWEYNQTGFFQLGCQYQRSSLQGHSREALQFLLQIPLVGYLCGDSTQEGESEEKTCTQEDLHTPISPERVYQSILGEVEKHASFCWWKSISGWCVFPHSKGMGTKICQEGSWPCPPVPISSSQDRDPNGFAETWSHDHQGHLRQGQDISPSLCGNHGIVRTDGKGNHQFKDSQDGHRHEASPTDVYNLPDDAPFPAGNWQDHGWARSHDGHQRSSEGHWKNGDFSGPGGSSGSVLHSLRQHQAPTRQSQHWWWRLTWTPLRYWQSGDLTRLAQYRGQIKQSELGYAWYLNSEIPNRPCQEEEVRPPERGRILKGWQASGWLTKEWRKAVFWWLPNRLKPANIPSGKRCRPFSVWPAMIFSKCLFHKSKTEANSIHFQTKDHFWFKISSEFQV